jgi:thiosulfate/3-mercaptopyruvate sulfurtransferase
MKNRILLSAEQLNELTGAERCCVVDCRYSFADTNKGRTDWMAGHIPGASYAHLDDDLSSPIQSHTGRHPLPSTADFAKFLSTIGWEPGTLLVAYDDGSNAVASRLWWLMRYYGQEAALLDGGLAGWLAAGFPLEQGPVKPEPAPLAELRADPAMVTSSEEIHNNLASDDLLVLDARAPERFSGAVENLDARAGHIPGAVNRPFGLNLDSRGRFRSPDDLRAQFEKLFAARESDSVVHSCGSGVTACHNLFAMTLAGMDAGTLYPGSWSEWIRDPDRPIEEGA